MKNPTIIPVVAGLAALALLSGCPEKEVELNTTSGRGYVTPADQVTSEVTTYPEDYRDPDIAGFAPYIEEEPPEFFQLEGIIHQSAKEAWKLVEISYFVIQDKWNQSGEMLNSGDPELVKAGGAMRDEVNAEIDSSIFEVNETVENLFLEAIELDPENAYNLATYALYLQPRKRWVDDVAIPTEPEALELMDQAIEMEPEKAIFCLLKIHNMTSLHVCHNWVRHYAQEEYALVRRLPEIRRLFDQAQMLEPDNGYIYYYSALLMDRIGQLVPSYNMQIGAEGETIEQPTDEEIMREIRAGNTKENLNFFFPPPLMPYESTYRLPVLRANNDHAVYIDHWNRFSMHNTQDIDAMVNRLAMGMTFAEDRQDIGELMVMLYQLGRVNPYDRSFFGLQLKLLQRFHESAADGSDEALQLAETSRYLDSQYRTIGQKLYKMDMIKDATKIGVIGVHETELNNSHKRLLADRIQGHHMAYLVKAREILGLNYTLYEQPEF